MPPRLHAGVCGLAFGCGGDAEGCGRAAMAAALLKGSPASGVPRSVSKRAGSSCRRAQINGDRRFHVVRDHLLAMAESRPRRSRRTEPRRRAATNLQQQHYRKAEDEPADCQKVREIPRSIGDINQIPADAQVVYPEDRGSLQTSCALRGPVPIRAVARSMFKHFLRCAIVPPRRHLQGDPSPGREERIPPPSCGDTGAIAQALRRP